MGGSFMANLAADSMGILGTREALASQGVKITHLRLPATGGVQPEEKGWE